jgi:hypothetical protein
MSTQKSSSISVRLSHEMQAIILILRCEKSVSEYIVSLIEADYHRACLLGEFTGEKNE